MHDIRELYHIAESAIAGAEKIFCAGIHRQTVQELKARGDFATDIDLEIERYLRTHLYEATGITVVGEEYGGQQGSPQWVVDPIDGTANYATHNPMSAILLSLLIDDQPVVALTAMPLLSQTFGAYKNSPLLCNGQPYQYNMRSRRRCAHVGIGAMGSAHDEIPSSARQEIFQRLCTTSLRPRITGSVGIDLAYAAAGIFDAAISFSPNIWDNAAGVLLVQAAGGVVSDLSGKPWHPGACGLVAGSAVAHEEIMSVLA
ncbi:inositol monophosphatase family protein [Corynebacterium sp. sy017]|uniref:inositol monophosphatase family protein n=1 Tax=unclassified Corynebacterium TaxID=2624378 RepID=UPI001185A528|nr:MULTISPECIES: inositol monophosphatase family protein [unclassified Corynebacterium]MBP3087920.1 inositol monophosphatase family protein [Corynebacterium sp. sy017]QDZ42887.1 inositol monophosphatase family protein [Corynebacterium sp. sy039]TSD92460.1 inositol monophosphatase family protein [Corynebacterium sp. SY003]